MGLTGKKVQSAAGTYIATGATPTTLLTNSQGANLVLRIEKLLILNVDTVNAVTLELYRVPTGGSISGDDFKIVKALSVKPSDGTFGTEDIREAAGILLENGDSLRALAGTASKLKFDLSYWAES